MTNRGSAKRSLREPGRPRNTGERAPLPRYRQIADELISDIRTGRWQVGDTLPGDIELTRRFRVGRHTVRAALQQLEQLGLISRRPRLGTILQATEPTEAYTHCVGSTAGLLQYPDNTPLQIITSGPMRVDRESARALNLPTGSQWHHLGGIRQARDSGPPLCWVDVYLLPELAAVEQRLGDHTMRIFEHVEQMTGKRVCRVTISLRATSIAPAMAQTLQVAAGSPALAIQRSFYDDDGVLFEVSLAQHPAGRFSYEIELSRQWIRQGDRANP